MSCFGGMSVRKTSAASLKFEINGDKNAFSAAKRHLKLSKLASSLIPFVFCGTNVSFRVRKKAS